ncbi:molecular chaperone [Vibrio sp. JPW-9-11-11]|uniref:TorD/DmsD family molecular chaperone n=1 Tax=Vibrio sp. JPW-9-11-11 TaxID=1416532 RepID=UPI001592F10B|nr:molecular chaperone [Vibrio sp. JPW-9-11-11]NVD06680.1 molecular chaperone [Vibrio sp. JPW-9-11-11]
MEQDYQSIRSDIYLVLAALFRQAPSDEMLAFLSSLETESADSAMKQAWQQISRAAQDSQTTSLADEYQELFIGIGRGEVMPFASWHLTGSLMEKPLADIRHDLELLGFERAPSVKEPEDHISALCEVMAALTNEAEQIQQRFFNRHIAPWFESLIKQIVQARHANFYQSVAQLCLAFFTIEQVRFSENPTSSKNRVKIDVKNVTEYEQPQS